MNYMLELLGFDRKLDYFFAEHLQETVVLAFKHQPGTLKERGFGAEFDYVCYVLAAYHRTPVHISKIADLVSKHCLSVSGLEAQEKIVAAEMTLLTCGFFRRQSIARGRNSYPLKHYAYMAQLFYQQLHKLLASRTYARMSSHLPNWLKALDLLARWFEENNLARYVINDS